MTITQADCTAFQQLCLDEEGVVLTPDEAREILSRLCFLYEQFAGWVAHEKVAGRTFDAIGPADLSGGV